MEATKLSRIDVDTTRDMKNTIEVNYIKITVDVEVVLELNKYNYICRVGGTNCLAEVRDTLGLA